SGGDYKAVGTYVGADGGKNHGRGLGKYQFMSYREDVIGIFSRKQGGLDLLNRIKANTASVSEIKSQLPLYFPPAIQEQIREGWLKKLINIAQSKGFSGLALIDRVGGMHNAGENDYAASFAQETVVQYQKELPKSRQKCQEGKKTTGVCTGKYIKPAVRGVKTSGFGPRNIGGKFGFHRGVDLAAAEGTPILAADGGEVEEVVNSCGSRGYYGNPCGGKYGNHVDIRHCNGWITRYAHLSQVRVKRGQKVLQGQQLGDMGTSGSSTGVHLHFEVRINGEAVNPEKYLPKLSIK
ncbi:MAG: M23 family metallopeptidase, partial [Microcystaceae cyanobacterium]